MHIFFFYFEDRFLLYSCKPGWYQTQDSRATLDP